MSVAPETSPLARPVSLLRLPVGLSSPLWGFYAGAAVTGAAWWWMTRWTQPQNLEAMFGRATEAVTPALAEPVMSTPAEAPEAPEASEASDAVEAAGEPVIAEMVEPLADAAPEAVVIAEAIMDEPEPPAPVGAEAAPLAPVVAMEAPAAAKPRAKKVAPGGAPKVD